MPFGEGMTAFLFIKHYKAGASNKKFMGSIPRLKHQDCKQVISNESLSYTTVQKFGISFFFSN